MAINSKMLTRRSFLKGKPQGEAASFEKKAVIEPGCLVKKGVQCQSCQDHCDMGAIRFRYGIKAIPEPVILLEDCTGCGDCVSICPVSAIKVIEHPSFEKIESKSE